MAQAVQTMHEPEPLKMTKAADPGDGHEGCGHDHGHLGHHHPPVDAASGRRLLGVMLLNLAIPTAQVAGGILANSVALLSDATHNFSDFAALVVAYAAFVIAQRGATVRHTFGFRRAEVLAALVNVGLLLGASGYIAWEALHRLRHPEPVSGLWVIALAGVGVVGNGFSAWLLHKDASHSLNVRGAFVHMLGDFLTSVAVLVNGAVLTIKPWNWLDPALSLLIVLFILKNCWDILREAVGVLMNAAPHGLDIAQVKEDIERIPGVVNAHYLHAWSVGGSSVAFSCHLVVEDQPLSGAEVIKRTVRERLHDRYGIDHPVVELETSPCGHGSLLCELSCNGDDQVGGAGSRAVKPHDGGTETGGWTLGRGLHMAGRVFLGLVFLYASYDKILHPWDFAQVVFQYQILPEWAVNAVALVLPWMEAMVGVCLVTGVWAIGALLAADGLLTVFLAAVVFNWARGLDIDCGCFSTSGHGSGGLSSMAWTALRDAVLLAAAVATTRYHFRRVSRKGRP
ncbi:cation diffusion facilitator family transporter [Desulfacinum hydrothermale DSM 13146]|uniref:Cation diffusion facilitator family transporter n=1 Tax=Desulfacinum hydrothermale DSM 13146 TaxID=1121390 RepID=A0A1W1XQC3_9BACT|nr:cation diffusion facilitator family transporter [Desulfacinum hydrothermale]SMC25711.1 cation diffusion facilitator family transporter [Desulfacinum hydrothermale DSM 13146]